MTEIIKWFESIYGNMCVSRGKVHDYLDMNLDSTDRGKVRILMVPFLKQVIKDFPEVITGSAASPAAAHHLMFEMMWKGESLMRNAHGLFIIKWRSCYLPL